MRTMLIAFLSSLATLTATAAIFERDLFEPGDGLLTYDDVNQREWLDLTYTEHYTLDDLVTATAPSGPLREFRLAMPEDLNYLASSAGVEWIEFGSIPPLNGPAAFEFVSRIGVLVDHTQRIDDLNSSGVTFFCEGNVCGIDFNDLHSFTVEEALGLRLSAGFVQAVPPNRSSAGPNNNFVLITAISVGSPNLASSIVFNPNQTSTGGGIAFTPYDVGTEIEGPYWLYREAVPEPSTAILSLAGAIAATSLRSRRRCF